MEHKQGEQLITNDPIANTPFRLVGNPTQGYAITIGLHRLTEPKPTKEDTLNILNKPEWNLIANMIVAITRTYDEIEHPVNKIETVK